MSPGDENDDWCFVSNRKRRRPAKRARQARRPRNARKDVSPETFLEAQKLARVVLTRAERLMASEDWARSMAPLYERRTGPRKVELDSTLPPGSSWNPALPAHQSPAGPDRFCPARVHPGLLPTREDDIAFAPLTHLSSWLKDGQLTSRRLTRLYLDRLTRFDPRLRCVITLLGESAMAQAEQADREIAEGRYRGPLHGIPWGAKDLLDTAGVATTYGAEPFRNRVPETDAVVVGRLHDAGAVLVAKLSLGGLALNDIWFGGQTMNPWLLEEGSSGSSAGSAAATAAGLVGFSIASETGGSIVNPCMRCGTTGLRPTFGRVARTGAMTLCWSLDKLGPITRAVEDTMLVLRAIAGPDEGDVSSVPAHLDYDASAPVEGLRVGYVPEWMTEAPATQVDLSALETLRAVRMVPVEVSLPDWPYQSLDVIQFAEAAAAFEELTLSHEIDQLRAQSKDAWPNRFRQARFLSAVDFVQADRFRRKVARLMDELFSGVDVLLVPSLREEMRTISNFTGHPSLTLPAGFVEISHPRSDWIADRNIRSRPLRPPARVPHTVTLIGRLFDEGTLARVGLALEGAFKVAGERPAGF
jgi:Asp-tRNA(Asn)/Glu-tRNA(Gln) amidotransferase A subunit family amidase